MLLGLDKMNIGQIGFGFVGGALHKSLLKKGITTKVYDKYKHMGSITDVLDADILFICLPTPHLKGQGFDLSAITENLEVLDRLEFTGLIVIKSTLQPGTSDLLAFKYHRLNICHNPEFLTARSADADFHNQKHIVLGYTTKRSQVEQLAIFFENHYPQAEISVCRAEESEAMKIFCNSFYAIKVQAFNEFYSICDKTGIDYPTVKNLMLKNNWINPMHTQVPGPDGQLSYGGACFPKDTNALNDFMESRNSPNKVLKACIEERNKMRKPKRKVDIAWYVCAHCDAGCLEEECTCEEKKKRCCQKKKPSCPCNDNQNG